MMRALSSLATSWTAYRLLRQDRRLATMDAQTAKKWADCIPLWTAKLPHLNLVMHRAWFQTLYRHGHLVTQDETFWKALQKSVTKSSSADLDMAMTQAGLFGNPMPFVHFEPYEDSRKNFLGETQVVTGSVMYMRSTFKHGTHPDLGSKLVAAGLDTDDLALFNLPIRGPDALFGSREDNSENYWRFFHVDSEFPIACLVDYYKSILAHNPSDTALASWTHAAWDARRTNTELHKGSHWETFESQVRPLFESRIDWELIAACHGFLLSPENARNGEVASYAQNNLMFKVEPMARSSEPDGMALAMLCLAEPKSPWEVYTLFSQAPKAEAALESYPIDFA